MCLNPALMYAKGGAGGQTGSANAGQVAGSPPSIVTGKRLGNYFRRR